MDITSIRQASILSVYTRTGADNGSGASDNGNNTSAGDSLILSLAREEQVIYSSGTGNPLSSAVTDDTPLDAIPVSRLGQNSRNTYLEMIRERVSYLLSEATGEASASQSFGIEKSDETANTGSLLDPYYSAEETAGRILNFALSFYAGGDPAEYAAMVGDAVMKGFAEAKAAWGDALPPVAEETISRVMSALQQFASGETA